MTTSCGCTAPNHDSSCGHHLADTLDAFLAKLTMAGASPETIRAYRSDLRGFILWMDATPSPDPIEMRAAKYLTTNRSSWAAATTLRKLTAIRSWAKWAGDPDFLTDYRAPTPAINEPHPVAEGMRGVDAMLEVASTPRKRALVALCGLLGLRVSEACAVMPNDIDIAQMSLKVTGKGDKVRYVPISQRAWTHLHPAMLAAAIDGGTLVGTKSRSARA